jgi:polyhydroxyalkanoate synthesis repressor PhaR
MTEPVIIKKYANRRLYNTDSSTYVTLETLAEMVHDNIDFIVYDAKSGEDLTRGVLTQIIVEQEGKGTNLLPISFLRQLISMYGGDMQSFVPKYLEDAMKHFTTQQQTLQQNMQESFGKMFPFGNVMEQATKQNMAMFEQFFAPFKPSATATKENEDIINALKQKISEMDKS